MFWDSASFPNMRPRIFIMTTAYRKGSDLCLLSWCLNVVLTVHMYAGGNIGHYNPASELEVKCFLSCMIEKTSDYVIFCLMLNLCKNISWMLQDNLYYLVCYTKQLLLRPLVFSSFNSATFLFYSSNESLICIWYGIVKPKTTRCVSTSSI